MIFELVRVHEIDHRLSRFQAMFGCDSLEKSRAFSAWRNCHGPVYKVESEPSKNLDLAFLDTDNTISPLHRGTRHHFVQQQKIGAKLPHG